MHINGMKAAIVALGLGLGTAGIVGCSQSGEGKEVQISKNLVQRYDDAIGKAQQDSAESAKFFAEAQKQYAKDSLEFSKKRYPSADEKAVVLLSELNRNLNLSDLDKAKNTLNHLRQCKNFVVQSNKQFEADSIDFASKENKTQADSLVYNTSKNNRDFSNSMAEIYLKLSE